MLQRESWFSVSRFRPPPTGSSLQMSEGGRGGVDLMMIATPAGHLGRRAVLST
jgi:hypothetical protein